MKFTSIAAFLIFISFRLWAQDPEFPKEFIMHLNVHSGMVTNFNGNTPDVYIGGVQLVPQYTFVTNLIRGGVIVDGFYTDKKVQGAFGPTISIKLLTIKAQPFGSLGNIHFSIDYLWGSEKQRLIGGGPHLDLANWIVLGFTVHRDYHLNNWLIQSNVAFRISKKTKIKPI